MTKKVPFNANNLPIVIVTFASSRTFATLVGVWRSDAVHRVRLLVVTDSLFLRCRLKILVVVQIAAIDIVVQTRWRLRCWTLNGRRRGAVVLTIWTLTRCWWWAPVAGERRCKVLRFASIDKEIQLKFARKSKAREQRTVLKSIGPARCRMASLREHHSICADAVRRHYHVCTKLFLIHWEWQICRGP